MVLLLLLKLNNKTPSPTFGTMLICLGSIGKALIVLLLMSSLLSLSVPCTLTCILPASSASVDQGGFQETEKRINMKPLLCGIGAFFITGVLLDMGRPLPYCKYCKKNNEYCEC